MSVKDNSPPVRLNTTLLPPLRNYTDTALDGLQPLHHRTRARQRAYSTVRAQRAVYEADARILTAHPQQSLDRWLRRYSYYSVRESLQCHLPQD